MLLSQQDLTPVRLNGSTDTKKKLWMKGLVCYRVIEKEESERQMNTAPAHPSIKEVAKGREQDTRGRRDLNTPRENLSS